MSLPTPEDGSTALITGASSGIGAALAKELAGRGHGVTLVARSEEPLRTLADELASQHGVRAEAIACDVTDPAARDRLAAAVEAAGLRVDVLANNAGFGTYKPFVEIPRERVLEETRVNTEAVVDLTGQGRGRDGHRVVPRAGEVGLPGRIGGARLRLRPAEAAAACTRCCALAPT